jgi:AraC-like DNA-binding protein
MAVRPETNQAAPLAGARGSDQRIALQCCLQVGFQPAPDVPFYHAVKPIFDRPRMAETTLSPGFLVRDKALVRDGDDSLSFLVGRSRQLNIMHRGREVQLGSGEATLTQADATGQCGSPVGFTTLDIVSSPAEWEARGCRPGGMLMHRISRNSEALKLLNGYARALERAAPAMSAATRDLVHRHVVDLVVLAASPHGAIGESSTSAVVAARLAAALDRIRSSFQDPDLSLAAVARSLRISPRYLQRLLEIGGTSFTAQINELRLQRARALLTAEHRDRERISDVALQAGFSDISYFNKLFRSRFGGTPKDLRAQVRSG